MISLIPNILNVDELQQLKAAFDEMSFTSGKATTAVANQSIKHNLQRQRDDEFPDHLDYLLIDALQRNEQFNRVVIPRRIRPPMYCRYESGMHYGLHTDSALMGGGNSLMRTDLSITVFLNEPEDYQGGGLIIQSDLADEEIKLPAGSGVVYPSTFLHSVESVTAGKRDVAVLWAQSYVREASDRQILFDLGEAAALLSQSDVESHAAQLINKTHTNLLRKMADG